MADYTDQDIEAVIMGPEAARAAREQARIDEMAAELRAKQAQVAELKAAVDAGDIGQLGDLYRAINERDKLVSGITKLHELRRLSWEDPNRKPLVNF